MSLIMLLCVFIGGAIILTISGVLLENMLLFYFLILLSLLPACFFQTTSKRSSKIYLAAVFVVLGALMMLRNIEVGNDTKTYFRIFEEISYQDNLSRYIAESRFETGYIYFNRILSRIWNDPQILLIVSGAFVAFSFARFFYKYSELPWMSVYMFLTLQFFDLSLSGVRQILAVAIVLFSYDFCIKRKPIPFCLVVLLATSIHTSAVLMLLLYPLTVFKPGKYFYVISGAVGAVCAVSFGAILRLVFAVFPQYAKYFTDDGRSFSTTPTLACALMLALFLVLFVISAFIRTKRIGFDIAPDNTANSLRGQGTFVKEKADIDDIMMVSIWFGIIMLLLSLNGTILNRFKYVFSVPILTYYPNSLLRIKNDMTKLFMIVGSCVVFLAYIMIIYYVRPLWQSTFPYYFFWQSTV